VESVLVIGARETLLENKPRSAALPSQTPSLSHGDRSESPIRVLVVDDFQPFRLLVRSMLERKAQFVVIGEASDGIEAVQKAEHLRPDLVVLDIGLPRLNGIDAARQIRKVSPDSKILVLTQESSSTVVQAVLGAGALGYVVKTHAGSELLAAVEAVCQGRRFISGATSGHELFRAMNTGVSEPLGREDAPPQIAPKSEEITRRHKAEFYSDDESFLNGFSRFIAANLRDGNAVVVVASHFHRNNLLERLRAQDLKIETAIEQRRYIALDVADTLSTFMVNDLPDPARFLKAADDLVAATAKATNGNTLRIAACGECAPTLWEQGNSEAAVQLERLWDEIARKYHINILCGYRLNSSDGEQESEFYGRICAEHSSVHTV
jgi:DNA-binding NarL/FixJ family response regulator